VLIDVSSAKDDLNLNQRRMCPDTCGPLPTVSVPYPVVVAANNTDMSGQHNDYAVTCSMTLKMARRILSHEQALAHLSPLQQFFITVGQRVLAECNEHPNPEHGLRVRPYQRSEGGLRRKVTAVVIWVGQYGNMKLIHQQSMMLIEQPFHGTEAVVGWAATDQLYGCAIADITCVGNNGRFKYLPDSNINAMKAGWGCAQRRPLRALAHVLTLFDPLFIISLDDDSFCNYPLLMERYKPLIMDKMRTEPLFLGEFAGRTGPQGHLTTQGLFVGGAGYILGNKLLSRLVRHEMHAYGYETWPGHAARATREKQFLEAAADALRSADQIKHLSVLAEGIEEAAQHCARLTQRAGDRSAGGAVLAHGDRHHRPDGSAEHNSCIYSVTPRTSKQRGSSWQDSTVNTADAARPASGRRALLGSSAAAQDHDYATVPLAVRLVDFCVNLMAAANTCQHRY
jgi:hypothetical protein